MPSPYTIDIETLETRILASRTMPMSACPPPPPSARNLGMRLMHMAVAYGAGRSTIDRMWGDLERVVAPRKAKRPRRWRQLELFPKGVPQVVTQRARSAPTCAPSVPVSLNEINHLAIV